MLAACSEKAVGAGFRRLTLPEAECDLPAYHLDELDWFDAKPEGLKRVAVRISPDDGRAPKPMSVAGINSAVATSAISAIANISRFPTPDRLESSFGLTPRVRPSGDHHGLRRHLQTRRHGGKNNPHRGCMVGGIGAGTTARRLSADQAPQGGNIAEVATARRTADLIRQLMTNEAPYRSSRSALEAMEIRKPELRLGAPKAHDVAGFGRD